MAFFIPRNFTLDILDEQFQQYLEIAKNLMEQLKNTRDRQICAKYIQRCCKLVSESLHVKRYRNEFFKYFLKMLDTAVFNQAYYIEMMGEKRQMDDEEKSREVHHWNEDKTSYVATKIIPGYAMLVYMAVSNKPEEGWQVSGFKDYEF